MKKGLTTKGFTLIRTLLCKNLVNVQQGFTLIELLVVLSIMGILIGLTLFGVSGARESSRDAKRKSDLELIRGAIEVYRADCNRYPVGNSDTLDALATSGTSLTGDNSTTSCSSTNTYISDIPLDPRDPTSNYWYYSADGTTYELCAALEQGPDAADTVYCGTSTNCGGALNHCNYKVTNP